MDLDPNSFAELIRPSPQKKPKLKKVRRDVDDEFGELIVDVDSTMIPPKPKQMKPMQPPSTSSAKKRKKRDSASSDEERWLTAIESGKLDDVDDELKKIKPKDPSLMTARQRAMYDRGAEGASAAAIVPQLISLPTGYKEKVLTPEAIQKAAIKSQKRKQLADEKREKDKKKTMERLLKKQESKALKAKNNKLSKQTAPVIIYRQTVAATSMTFPSELQFPIARATVKPPPTPVFCIMNCGNLKKYCCSKTGMPLCSLECYKMNAARMS